MSYFGDFTSGVIGFAGQAANIVSDGVLQGISREVDEEFADDEPQLQDDRTHVSAGFDSQAKPAGQMGFNLPAVSPANLMMLGGALVAAVVVIKLVK